MTSKVLKNYPGWSLTLLPLNRWLISVNFNFFPMFPFSCHPTSFHPPQFAFYSLSVIQKYSKFFSCQTQKKWKFKITRIISDKGFLDVFFFGCRFGSVRKFCYLFWGILKLDFCKWNCKNESYKIGFKSVEKNGLLVKNIEMTSPVLAQGVVQKNFFSTDLNSTTQNYPKSMYLKVLSV